MKKEYIIPQLEEIVLNSKGALLTESMTKNEETVTKEEDVLSIKIFDDDNEDW